MAELVVEKSVCGSCGAKVREASSFCYNCGESVNVEPEAEVSSPAQTVSNNGRSVERSHSVGLDDLTLAEEPIKDEKWAEVEPAAQENTKLHTAASVRRKAKAYNRKPIEVAWVARERSPAAFVIVSIVLALFAAILLVLALYMR